MVPFAETGGPGKDLHVLTHEPQPTGSEVAAPATPLRSDELMDPPTAPEAELTLEPGQRVSCSSDQNNIEFRESRTSRRPQQLANQ